MSESIRRRSSSKQLLQNLIRVTAQRSQEDAEEVERERRRRAREKQRGEPHQHNNLRHNTESDEELKPSSFVLEEDEGFSDWSHRLENRSEQEMQEVCRAKEKKISAPAASGENKQQRDEEECEPRNSEEASTKRPDKGARQQHAAGRPADRTSYLAAGTMKPRNLDQITDPVHIGGACRMHGKVERKMHKQKEEEKPAVQRERKESQQSSGDEEDQEEELSFTCDEKENLHIRKEEGHHGGGAEEAEQDERSAEVRRRMSEEPNSGASDLTFSDSEESLNCYGPMSPTFKKLLIQFYPEEVSSRASADGKCTINERTESLRRSTSSTKKTPPPLPVSKIDKRLEQYTHALEVSSKEGRSSCQTLTDLLSPSEPVTSKKNLFEAGEAWNQNVVSVTQSKDADGLKVGVAGLINQWVKGGEDGTRSSSPSKPAEIRPGGVLNKKNLWESLGDSSTGDGKENSTKRYKFVVKGHGKYTKVSSDNGCTEDPNYQAAGQVCEDL